MHTGLDRNERHRYTYVAIHLAVYTGEFGIPSLASDTAKPGKNCVKHTLKKNEHKYYSSTCYVPVYLFIFCLFVPNIRSQIVRVPESGYPTMHAISCAENVS